LPAYTVGLSPNNEASDHAYNPARGESVRDITRTAFLKI
jgi:hypothetical protein